MTDDCSIVCCVFNSSRCVALLVLLSENLATHKSYTASCSSIAACYACNTLSVVVACANSTSNVCAVSVVVRFDFASNNTVCRYEVVTVNVVYKSVTVIIYIWLAVLFLFVYVEVIHQIFVGNINTTIDNGNNNIALTCRVLFPYRLYITVGSFLCVSAYRTIVVIMPLF